MEIAIDYYHIILTIVEIVPRAFPHSHILCSIFAKERDRLATKEELLSTFTKNAENPSQSTQALSMESEINQGSEI